MNIRNLAMVISFMGILSSVAFADMGVPSYIATSEQKADLEAAVKNQLKSVTSVQCRNTIVVATGGRNTATAGVCILDKNEYQLNCKNDMLGSVAASVRLHPDQTEESELRSLIADQCTGG